MSDKSIKMAVSAGVGPSTEASTWVPTANNMGAAHARNLTQRANGINPTPTTNDGAPTNNNKPVDSSSISGNNSDNNSTFMSLGYNSFGFNFDSEEGMNMMKNISPLNSEKSESDELDNHRGMGSSGAKGGNNAASFKGESMSERKNVASSSAMAAVGKLPQAPPQASLPESKCNDSSGQKRKASSLQGSGSSNGYNSDDEASKDPTKPVKGSTNKGKPIQITSFASPSMSPTLPSTSKPNNTPPTVKSLSHPSSVQDQDHSMRNEEEEDDDDASEKGKKQKKKPDDLKREERNAREKERSFRIAKQINELRTLLSTGGVIVPKGTKSSVLTEAANYIRMLQQHQYRTEIERQQLIQQMQYIGGGALGPQAASAIRYVSAQNGVWGLGNFGGMPPQLSSSASSNDGNDQQIKASNESPLVNKIEPDDYKYVFEHGSIGLAIASMGGALVDCNQLFCKLSQYSKQEVCAMTIFNLTNRADLQPAFDLISQMISPSGNVSSNNAQPLPTPKCVLRGNMKHRSDLGLEIALIKGDDGIAKCFSVALIKNPASPFDTSQTIYASMGMLASIKNDDMNSPAFMSG